MNEQIGWRGFLEGLKNEAPRYAQLLPELPRLLHQTLQRQAAPAESPLLPLLLAEQRRTNRLLQVLIWGAVGFLAGVLATRLVVSFGFGA
jgi:ubiquinone biosynthesis protein